MSASAGAEGSDPNLTPLLDLVLQLIMFFMITVNFVRVDQFADEIKLPVAQNATPLDNTAEEFLFLNLNPKGDLVGTLSNYALDTPGKMKVFLTRELVEMKRASRDKGNKGVPKIVIVLRADMNCRYRDVWSVLDSCKQAGFVHWQLRVMTKPG